MLVLAPETIPFLLRTVVALHQLVLQRKIAESRPNIDMGLAPEFPEQIFDARVLPKRLDESADRIFDRIAHLGLELRKPPRLEAVADPLAADLEIEVRVAD